MKNREETNEVDQRQRRIRLLYSLISGLLAMRSQEKLLLKQGGCLLFTFSAFLLYDSYLNFDPTGMDSTF